MTSVSYINVNLMLGMSNLKKRFKRRRRTELKSQKSAVHDSKRQLNVYLLCLKI